MKIGKDWKAYTSAGFHATGNKQLGKAFETLHKLDEQKRNRKALKERNTKNIDAHHEGHTDTVNWND